MTLRQAGRPIPARHGKSSGDLRLPVIGLFAPPREVYSDAAVESCLTTFLAQSVQSVVTDLAVGSAVIADEEAPAEPTLHPARLSVANPVPVWTTLAAALGGEFLLDEHLRVVALAAEVIAGHQAAFEPTSKDHLVVLVFIEVIVVVLLEFPVSLQELVPRSTRLVPFCIPGTRVKATD